MFAIWSALAKGGSCRLLGPFCFVAHNEHSLLRSARPVVSEADRLN
jgi:hypothetical protein